MRTVPAAAVEVIDRGAVCDLIAFDRAACQYISRLVDAADGRGDAADVIDAQYRFERARVELYRNFGVMPPSLRS